MKRSQIFEDWFAANLEKIKNQLHAEFHAKLARGEPITIGKKKTKKRPKCIDYHEYIKSPEWKAKSKKWRDATGKCEECGSTHSLECHHLHYKTLGKEKRSDIKVLCHKCHCKVHGVEEF